MSSPALAASSSRCSAARSWNHVKVAVALTFAVPLVELQAPTRRRSDAAFARQVAMYMARVVLGMPYTAVGRLCRRDHKTVAHACRTVERRREDPAVDRVLQALEALYNGLPATGRRRSGRRRA